MNSCKIFGLNMKLKNDKGGLLPLMTVTFEEKEPEYVTNMKHYRNGRPEMI